MMKFYKFTTGFIFSMIYSLNVLSNPVNISTEKKVVDQMNYCIMALTNIIHNKSIAVLEHETNQLINNLTMAQIIGMDEINDFREDLLDKISKLQITEEERTITKRLQSIKRDNMKWQALSNALSPAMIMSGGGRTGPQLAFNVLLTAARSAVEYKMTQGEQNIEELQAMWELRKNDMENISEIRKNAQHIIFKLFNKYQLNEYDRLTEETANKLNTIISTQNAAQRVRLLERNKTKYKGYSPYYYHLGMAYLDLNKYNKAKECFNVYVNMYQKNPILRYDERSGCIALTRLKHEPHLSNQTKDSLINIALNNLPSNSAAVLQCAMVKIYEEKQIEQGLRILLAGIDDPYASDRNILLMAAANLIPIIKKYPSIYNSINYAFMQAPNIQFDTYLTYIVNTNANVWKTISKVIKFDDYSTTDNNFWDYASFFISRIVKNNRKKLDDEMDIILSNHIIYNPNDIKVYIEKHDNDEVKISQLQLSYANGATIKEIEKVDCFKQYKELKYLFLEAVIPNEVFLLKANLDYKKIENGDWHGMSEFVLSENDIEDIIDFCRDHETKDSNTILKCEEWDADKVKLPRTNGADVIYYGEENIGFTPHHSKKQEGDYLRIVCSNDIQIMFKYNNDKDVLEPYFYSKGNNFVFANRIFEAEYGVKKGWLSNLWERFIYFYLQKMWKNMFTLIKTK